jgi:sugar phosphate isomerase/epimerase
MFGNVPADAEGKTLTGIRYWCARWPDDPAWRFVAVGTGHDLEYWTQFLRVLAEINPDMAVNIEHEDASYSRIEGLAIAAENLRAAAAKM